MNKEIQVLSNVQIGNVILPIYGTAEEPLFKAADVANAIELNDVSRMLEYVDEEDKLRRVLFVSGQNRQVWFLTEDGLYEVFFQSRKPIAKQFKKQVKGILKELRLKGEVSIKPNRVSASQAKASMIIIEAAKRMLNLSDSSVAALTNKVAKTYELPVVIDYVEAKDVKASLTTLLQRFKGGISAIEFNKRLAKGGFIEHKSRASHKGEKKFWALTDKGLEFGENMVNPNNEREVQPMYYESMFDKLLNTVIPSAL